MTERNTPAERAGATHLDTSRLNPAIAGAPDATRRSTPPPTDVDDSDLAVQVMRRRRQRRRSIPWLGIAAVTAAIGLLLSGSSMFAGSNIDVSTGWVSRVMLGTPVASARRVPDFIVEPIAARNLGASLQPILAKAPQGTCVQLAEGSHPVAVHNQELPLVPASNMKILTAAAAIATLGGDTRLQTRFLTDGKPTDGATVKGNLYMVGGGDPLLTTAAYARTMKFPDQPGTDLDAIADKIVATGIRHVTGSVVGDGSRYDRMTTVESWPDRYFAQGQVSRLSALMVDDTRSPGIGYNDDPPRHAAAVLTGLLRDRGVTIDGQPTSGTAPEGASALLDVPSLTIAETAAQMLRFSDNTTAESLTKEMGRFKGSAGSTAEGTRVMTEWARSVGLATKDVMVRDGSGLSPDNRVTCSLLSGVLGLNGPDGPLASGLAVPGQPGTLSDRFKDPPLDKAVRAKTGTLNGVTSLSGWLRTVAGVPLDFSIIVNVDGRAVAGSDMALQNDILAAALAYPQAPDPSTLGPVPVARTG